MSAIAADSPGNAYVAGTTNPNFPVVGGSGLGTHPALSGMRSGGFSIALSYNGTAVAPRSIPGAGIPMVMPVWLQ
jgi:hypothetical protein